MLTNIEITNFRGFEKLTLNGLGRVNLIVGRNNTGKTSLLEAVVSLIDPSTGYKYASLFRKPGNDPWIKWVLYARAISSQALITGNSGKKPVAVKIWDRKSTKPTLKNSEIAGGVPITSDDYLIEAGGQKTLDSSMLSIITVQDTAPTDVIGYISKALSSTESELVLTSLLHSVDSRIQDIRLTLTGNIPAVVVDIGLGERLPLHQLGQGINRLVGIFSKLMGDKPGTCIIDEIENGIHYTALPEIWTGLANVAEKLNIQIFATTHSRECLEAAHQVFSQRTTYDFRVIQLYRMHTGTEGRVLDRELIDAGIKGEIDLR